MSLLSKIISLGIILSSISPQLKSLRFNKGTSLDVEEPSNETLLKEYEVCQSHINSLGYQYWIGVGVFMAVNTALLGAFLYGIVQSNIDFRFFIIQIYKYLAPSLITIILGIGMIIILRSLIMWLKRINSNVQTFYVRMREIETILGMWRGWIVYGLDNWDNLPKSESNYLLKYHPQKWWEDLRKKGFYEPPRGFQMVKVIFTTLIVIWMIISAGIICVFLLLLHELIGLFVLIVAALVIIAAIFLHNKYLKAVLWSKS